MDAKSRSFQRRGWNGNGSRMLAVASWIAKEKEDVVMRKFADIDIFLLFVAASLCIKFITNPVALVVMTSVKLTYIIKKLVSKYSLEDVLSELDGDTQKILVLKFMDFCEMNNIDPESISELCQKLEEPNICDKFYKLMCTFVVEDTKYYIL